MAHRNADEFPDAREALISRRHSRRSEHLSAGSGGRITELLRPPVLPGSPELNPGLAFRRLDTQLSPGTGTVRWVRPSYSVRVDPGTGSGKGLRVRFDWFERMTMGSGL